MLYVVYTARHINMAKVGMLDGMFPVAIPRTVADIVALNELVAATIRKVIPQTQIDGPVKVVIVNWHELED